MTKEFLIKILIILSIIFFILLIVFIAIKIHQIIKNKTIGVLTDSPVRAESLPTNKFDSLIIADTSKSVQTQFFRESSTYALEVIKGKEPLTLQDVNFKGKDIIDTLKFMNEEARSNIYIAIQYMMVSRPDGEEHMRQISYKEEIPMWMVIIRTAMLQTIPNIKFDSHSSLPLMVSFSKTA